MPANKTAPADDEVAALKRSLTRVQQKLAAVQQEVRVCRTSAVTV